MRLFIALSFLLLLSSLKGLEAVEFVAWNTYIGTEATGTNSFITSLYSRDPGFNQYCIMPGGEGANFSIVNSRELVCSTALSEGDYTVRIAIGNGGANEFMRAVRITVGPGRVYPKISSSDYLHTLFLARDGAVYACGRGNYGALGIGASGSVTTPVQIAAAAFNDEEIVDLYAGGLISIGSAL